MARWKIVDSVAAKDIGIEEISADNDGFLILDLAKLPMGFSVKKVIAYAEKNGIIMKCDFKKGAG